MLSVRRIRFFYWLQVLLLVTGALVWSGDINWWDTPPLSPSIASNFRVLHTFLALLLLLLLGSVYWHSKIHWKTQVASTKTFKQTSKKMSKKIITGLVIWLVVLSLMVSAIMLLYAPEETHASAVIMHAISGILLLVFFGLHHLVIRVK